MASRQSTGFSGRSRGEKNGPQKIISIFLLLFPPAIFPFLFLVSVFPIDNSTLLLLKKFKAVPTIYVSKKIIQKPEIGKKGKKWQKKNKKN